MNCLCWTYRLTHFHLNSDNLEELLKILQHGPTISDLEYVQQTHTHTHTHTHVQTRSFSLNSFFWLQFIK